ncbi:MAG: RodZ domain-containing protein [Cyanobacteria bacterium P01_A01_bin.123]
MKRKVRNLEQLHKEQLTEIGSILRQLREQQSLTLEAMGKRTLIRPALLAALESADLNQLPEPIYIRGLIKRYGNQLGTDGEMLASQFLPYPNLRENRPSWQQSAAAQLRPLHLYGLYVLILLASISGLSYWLKRNAPQATALPSLESTISEQTEPAESVPQPVQPQPTVSDQRSVDETAGRPIRIKIVLKSQSWMRVVADGETEFEGILQQGETKLWVASEALTLRVGDAGAVLVAYNDEQAKTLGEPGSVAEITYLPDQPETQNESAYLNPSSDQRAIASR